MPGVASEGCRLLTWSSFGRRLTSLRALSPIQSRLTGGLGYAQPLSWSGRNVPRPRLLAVPVLFSASTNMNMESHIWLNANDAN
jgi:hypothetical protein